MTYRKGDVLVFKSGVAVAILQPGRTVKVLVVQGNEETAKGLETWMSSDVLGYASPVDGFLTAETEPGRGCQRCHGLAAEERVRTG